MSKYFAALDAGSSEITAVAAKWDKNGDYAIEGFCRSSSRGFSKGLITDAALATDSVVKTMDKLKEKTGKKIHDLYAGVSSTSIGITPSCGVLLLSKYGREITGMDIKKCLGVASIIKTPIDKEPLHSIVQRFSVDGEKEIKNPLNLEGVKLEAEVNILTINSSALNNMAKCISQAGYSPEGFVFSGLASSYRVLTDDDKRTNTCLLDINRDLTEGMIFCRGHLAWCRVFPVGTADLVEENGSVNLDNLEKLVSRVISLQGWNSVRSMTVIGEGGLTHDLVESLERSFPVPVKAGTCIARPFEDLPPERIGYIGSLGILDHLQEENKGRMRSGNVLKRGFHRFLGFVDRYF
jgi:hypothetical protein